MKSWKQVLIGPDTSIRETVKVIDEGGLQVALVVDDARHMLGMVTDGDIRRGILAGITLDMPVASLMNTTPLYATVDDDPPNLLALMRQHGVLQIPIVDSERVLLGLETLVALLQPKLRNGIVVLMAGGLGTRLRPLTDESPKPMLRVGDKPILETILQNFIDYGFHRFYLSVNYKAEMIRSYFGDGSRWGIEIRYLEEQDRLGTAGALSLLPENPDSPIIVMNGDILTRINFDALLDFHDVNGSAATLCVREYAYTVPYGVVSMDGNRLMSWVEKPEEKKFVSAGIYVLNPDVLGLIPKGSYYDMPTLFQSVMALGKTSIGFPIHEYWLDIGRMEDFERAHADYWSIFQ